MPTDESGDGILRPLYIVVERYGWGDWYWEVHPLHAGRPWWVSPDAVGSALTERGAHRAARRKVSDMRRRAATRSEVTV